MQDVFAERFDDRAPGGLAGFDNLAGQQVGIDHVGPTIGEHPRNRGLAGGQAASESDEQHAARIPCSRGVVQPVSFKSLPQQPTRVDFWRSEPVRALIMTTRLWLLIPFLLAAPAWGQEEPSVPKGPRTINVALDGTGEFRSIQEAVDRAGKGDTILVKAGAYPEDVTIHSKDSVKLIGQGVDQVIILGKDRVGSFHVGKWPYGATNIEISGMTISDRGGHAMGMFNGKGITLRRLKIKGMLFAQQVQDVRVEDCDIGGSETTGVQFADSQGIVIGNFIHDSDHGVNVAGKSVVRVERNVITRQLFDAVVVMDQGQAVLVNNTLVKNGGGAAFLARSRSQVSGNIVSMNTVGFTVAPSSTVEFAHNALFGVQANYVRPGTPPVPALELAVESNVTVDPGFFDPGADDFRLREDSPLLKIDGHPYLGALAPVKSAK